MLAIASVLIAILVSLLVTRFATMALMITGLPRHVARFQARSALTGVGFTTSEAEQIVNHPVRRRIAMLLMLIGNAGLVTILASTMLSFTGNPRGGATLLRLATLVGGLFLLFMLARSPKLDRILSPWMAKLLRRWDVGVKDLASMLQLSRDYGIHELLVEENDWMARRSLKELRLADEGVVVLGIHKPGRKNYIGAPRGDHILEAGDNLVVYGAVDDLRDLDDRRAGIEGERSHERAVEEQRKREEAERAEEMRATG